MAVAAAPFALSAYGLLRGRLNLETTHRRIRLGRLPKAFHGFRIAQLSDIHIGPFMTADQIRRYVAIANDLKPDLMVLTGDFITWDPSTQGPVVEALSGLKAPFGVMGCLGNHELWYEVEDSISGLFKQRGMRMLRQESAVLHVDGGSLNLIGVDFQSLRRMGPPGMRAVPTYLRGVEPLMRPESVNILLSHNPNTFDRAAELGIDLSLAGHTHGGQVTLEYIHPSLSPSRLITDYVAGWFEKDGSQLYVNRGIGTMFTPVRLGAPPEITVFELIRES
jgi:predicted MPP superfamily phosphohydrolase